LSTNFNKTSDYDNIRVYSKFPTEESCRLHLQTKREQSGIKYKKCSCTKHYWLKAKGQWQCSSYNFRTTLRAKYYSKPVSLGRILGFFFKTRVEHQNQFTVWYFVGNQIEVCSMVYLDEFSFKFNY